MNGWIWLLLLLSCCGCNNGGWQGGTGRSGGCGCNNNYNNDYYGSNSPCGCNDDLIQSRNFSGYSGTGTCGCENSDNNNSDVKANNSNQ